MSLVFNKEQALASRILDAHLSKNRLAHTYLFTGGNPEGKKALVMEFVLELLSKEREGEREIVRRKISAGNHPDLQWFGEDETVRILKIEQVRELIAWSVLKPYESTWKVFVIYGADRLNVQAQNALLKTLEEPPAHTIYCLLVENKSHLLETIKSRSFEIRLNPGPRPDEDMNPEMLAPEGFGEQRWEDFFESQQSLPKAELFLFLDRLMQYFHYLTEKSESSEYLGNWLGTLDALYETKQALDANVNQKLALTRLSIRFKRQLPSPAMLTLEA